MSNINKGEGAGKPPRPQEAKAPKKPQPPPRQKRGVVRRVREAGGVKRWARSQPVNWQLSLGCALAGPVALIHLAMIAAGPRLATMAMLFPAAAVYVSAGWLARPYIEGLPRRRRRIVTAAPMMLYIPFLGLSVLLILAVAVEDRLMSAILLLWVWAHHTLYGVGAEPSSSAYERLRGRLRRAAPMRIAVQWCGLIGVVLLLQPLRQDDAQRGVVLGIMATLTIAVVGASVRVLVRVRKLRVALYEHAQQLAHELEKLRRLPDDKRIEQVFAAEASWATLELTLRNKIDSGFNISGVFVLPADTLRELHHQVHRAIRAAGTDAQAHWAVMARLRTMRLACLGGTDTLA